jgi:hypothetical protein
MSDVQQVDWAAFRVANEGQYGGGSELGHHREHCDWHTGIDGLNPLDISELAAAHAPVCTGMPLPRETPAPQTATGTLLAAVWAEQILGHLRRTQP